MQNIEKFKKIVNEYELDEKEALIDENNMPWFTQKFLAKLFEVDQSTISRNIKELSKLNEINLKSNMQKCISISTNKFAEHYDINVLYSLGMWLRSSRALEFRKNIIKLLEGIRTGELKVLINKSIFDSIVSLPTTEYRQKVNDHMLEIGIPEENVLLRECNVKLTTAIKILLKNLGYGYLIPKIHQIMSKCIYGMEIQEWDEKYNITNPNTRRDYQNSDQWFITQFVEREFLKSVVNSDNYVSDELLIHFAKDCTNRALELWNLIGETKFISGYQEELCEV